MTLELNANVTLHLIFIPSSMIAFPVLMFMSTAPPALMMPLTLKEIAMLVLLEVLQLTRELVKEDVLQSLTVRLSVETAKHVLFVTLTSGSTHQQLLTLVLLVQ